MLFPFSVRRVQPLTRTLRVPSRRGFSALSVLSAPITSAFCVIGDEILNGKALDANSQVFAQRCFALGVELEKIEVVPDKHQAIADSVRQLSRKYDIVFTSGGIGPTHDDITYEAIGRAFGCELRYHEPTMARMRRIMASRASSHGRWTTPNPKGTPDQIACARMALLPEPALVTYPCDQYWVPVVCVNQNVHIFPGIPRLFNELATAYLPGLVSRISSDAPQAFTRVLVGTQLKESTIAPVLEKLQAQYAPMGIKLGSYPNWMPPHVRVQQESGSTGEPENETKRNEPLVVLSAIGRDVDSLDACKRDLCSLLEGFEIINA
ncbi:hypothetical protein FB645_000601 [Coemansia sp. IMI 203386]|nr:hypothetical protein FB645_000601 [Coemansia sp. IMI 203386]